VNTIKYWVENHWHDFVEDKTLFEHLSKFLDRIGQNNKALAQVVLGIVNRKVFRGFFCITFFFARSESSSGRTSLVFFNPAPPRRPPRAFSDSIGFLVISSRIRRIDVRRMPLPLCSAPSRFYQSRS
jgi:hypothetical protein